MDKIMTTKRLLVFVVAFAVLSYVPFRLLARPSFTESLSCRIRIGVTELEVKRLLGGPAGIYTTGPGVRGVGSWPMPGDKHICADGWKNSMFPDVTYKVWMADEGLIGVVFDKEGKVTDKWWGPMDTRHPGNLLERAGWVLARLFH
jgi:hypothetical protein